MLRVTPPPAPHPAPRESGQELDLRFLEEAQTWRLHSTCSSLPQTVMTPKPAGTLDGSPDGGWGWAVAAAAFLVNGLSYGLLRSLGLALPDIAEHFGRTSQDTAWVSALALAVQQAASEPPHTPRGHRGRECSGGVPTCWPGDPRKDDGWHPVPEQSGLRLRGGAGRLGQANSQWEALEVEG